MAKSPALIEAVVAMTGESKAAVSVALARLRKANLVPVTGRGPYAIPMDEEAAMRLLLAVCASVPLEANSAVAAVGRFEHLTPGYARIEPEKDKKKLERCLMPLDELPEEHTVGQALKQLLRVAGKGELFTYKEADTGVRKKGYTNPDLRGYLRVEFMLPIPLVRIQHQFAAWMQKTWTYQSGSPINVEGYNTALRESGRGDCARKSVITAATIEEIGSILRT